MLFNVNFFQDEFALMEVILHEITSYAVVNDDYFTSCKNRIQAESDRIRGVLVFKALQPGKPKRVAHFIQYHQSRILELLDGVVEYLGEGEMASIHAVTDRADPVNLAKYLHLHLERLLLYIEKHFPHQFNAHLRCAKSDRYTLDRAIVSRLPELRNNFLGRGMDNVLMEVVLDPLHRFVNTPQQEDVSYREIVFLRNLLQLLEEQCSGLLTRKRLTFRMCLALCYLNYNSRSFFTYCIKAITRFVHAQPDLIKQIERLAFIQKVVNQVEVKAGLVYSSALPPVKDQLLNWIVAELRYTEKRQQLALCFPAQAGAPSQEDFKLKLDVSVSQLALFLKLLKEAGVIKNQNVLEVIRFVARVVQTRFSDTVSAESLRTKYYNPEEGARQALRQRVTRALELLRGWGGSG